MSVELVMRKAVPGEAKQVVSFYEQIISKRTEKDYKLWWNLDVYPTREDLTGAVRDGTLHIVLDDEHIIGAAILNRDQGDGYERIPWACIPEPEQIAVIHLVAVDPEQRGKGVGKELMNHIISEAEKMGVRSLRLDTMPHYSSAIRLYKKTGFVKRGEVTLYYPTTGDAVFLMYEKSLPPLHSLDCQEDLARHR